MHQVITILFKNSYKMLFLVLLLVSLTLTIQSHSYHKSRIISSANILSGGVYEKLNAAGEYLNLKSENEALAKENATLRSLLLATKNNEITDKLSDIPGVKNENVLVSKIIHNTFNSHQNFLTINSGSASGIKADMGVINSKGIIGIVDKTSKNYATVMSVLHVKSQINAKVKKSNHFGSLIWNGKNTGYVQLTDMPRLASVRKGDTIVTGGQSVIFPENINIGTIDKVYIDNQTNYYTIDVKLFNDMTNLGQVYIIKSKDREEIIQLEKTTVNE